jgi:hypothetical protein
MPLIQGRKNAKPDHAADGNGQGNGNGGNPQMTQGQTAVLRIRRLLIQERDSALHTAERIRRTLELVGRGNVEAELGDEAADLANDYAALKAFILAVDPDADVPDLPV